jgi:hypothetical protein
MSFTNIELHTSSIDTGLVTIMHHMVQDTVKPASRIRRIKKLCNLQ